MLVVIESTVGGNVAGYLQCNISGDETIKTLIDNYCESKVIHLFISITNSLNLCLPCPVGNLHWTELCAARPERDTPRQQENNLYVPNQTWGYPLS